MAADLPPPAEPTKRKFLRLCRPLHNRNYAYRVIMRSLQREAPQFPQLCWGKAAADTAPL